MAQQTTPLGYPYYEGSDSPAGHSQQQALAEFIDANPGISVFTQAQIDALTAAQKRQFRVIGNSTTGKLLVSTGSEFVEIAPSASAILAALLTVDGPGSGLDADTVDGVHASTLAPLASPAFTGTPTVPTAVAGTNTTQAASTAFTKTAVDGHSAATSGVHGVSGAVVGTTDTQTLSNKTLSSPSVSEGTVSAASTSAARIRNVTLSTSDPSGGSDGDVWIKYTA